jgi:hypothetical protein
LLFHWDAPFAGKNFAKFSTPSKGYGVQEKDSGSGHTFYAEYTVIETDADGLKRIESKTERVAIESDKWKLKLQDAARSCLVAINNRTSLRLRREPQVLVFFPSRRY